MKHIAILSFVLGVLAGVPGAASAEPPDDLGGALARLRVEIEDLSSRIEEQRGAMRSRLAALEARKADAELELQREQTRLAELERALADRRAANEQTREASQALVPVVREAASALRRVIAGGLPFRVADRTGELDDLLARMDQGLVRPGDALVRLWDRVEDELRLARESGLYSQVLPLEGGEVLADVARLGMVTILFRAPDGRVGRAERKGDGWTWTVLTGVPERESLTALFDSFRKQVRVGLFPLPLAFAEVSR